MAENLMRDKKPTILIADDEEDIRSLLRIVLSKDGYEIYEAENGKRAVELAKEHPEVSLFLLDIMMPEQSGLEAASAIRRFSKAPILFLTAKSADRDKIRAYEVGADDYIVKPFYRTDLRLKVAALIRRYGIQQELTRESGSEVVLSPEVTIDCEKKTVLRRGEPVPLTVREYDLLYHFATHRGTVFSPAEIYEIIWEESYLPTSSNTIMVHIANLRKKLESDPQNPTLIRTVWGKGYRMDS